MPNTSTNRVHHDALDLGDVSVRCACQTRGTLLVFSLGHFMRLGRDAALAMAKANCPRCRVEEIPHGN